MTAGPAFPFFGLGLTLYFASQGAGQVIGPVLAGTVRLVLVAGAGWWLAQHQGTADNFYALVAHPPRAKKTQASKKELMPRRRET